jgi:acetyl esterase/lipase
MRGKRLWLAAVLALLGGACLARAEDRPVPRDFLPRGVTFLPDLAYVPNGHERQKLDLYLPEKKSEGPLPVIIWIHGGAWREGDKWPCLEDRFPTRGYAAASINYRLSGDAPFPAAIEDCKAAVRWLRAHAKDYNLDPERIGVWGASAGGHLAALLGTSGDVKELEGKGGNLDQSSRVQAVVDWYGPTDLLQMGGYHDRATSPESKLIGGPLQEHKDAVARANPLTYLGKDAPPFLIMHGDADETVPLGQSELLAAALKKANVHVIFKKIRGAGHADPAFWRDPENWLLVRKFFDEHLKKAAKD